MERMSALAHAIKGTAGTLAASELQFLAAQLERAARKSDVDAPRMAEHLAVTVEAMLSALITPKADKG
jgi:HPt (histidine-containing phosphotransfer) domain-containing protein